MDDKEKVIDRIRKLLALSRSPNENEAAMAAEKVQAMLAEYNLSLADVTTEESAIGVGEIETESSPWRRQIAGRTAELYFCGYFYAFRKYRAPHRKAGYIRKDVHSFVGEQHNAKVAAMMFIYLERAVESLAKESARDIYYQKSKYLASFKTACSLRLAQRLMHKLAEAKAGGQIKTETGTTLPALASLYDQAQAQINKVLENMPIKEAEQALNLSDPRGAADGFVAGGRIGLDPQVEHRK